MPTTCLAIAPATGAVTGRRDKLPATLEVTGDEHDAGKRIARCGSKCAALRALVERLGDPAAAVDATGKLAFVIDGEYPSYGTTWSLVTGKRLARFKVAEFDGPPPPTSFDHVEIVGRHAFVGDPGEPYTVTYDLYTGATSMLFEHEKLAHGLVIHNDGMGRVDLLDYTQPGAPRVAVRRVRASKQTSPTLTMKTVTLGERAVVVLEDPQATLLVDTRKRTISKPRPLPRCAP